MCDCVGKIGSLSVRAQLAVFEGLMTKIHIARCITLDGERVRAGLDLIDRWYHVCDKQSVMSESEWEASYERVLAEIGRF